jgi:hypothetical protein
MKIIVSTASHGYDRASVIIDEDGRVRSSWLRRSMKVDPKWRRSLADAIRGARPEQIRKVVRQYQPPYA